MIRSGQLEMVQTANPIPHALGFYGGAYTARLAKWTSTERPLASILVYGTFMCSGRVLGVAENPQARSGQRLFRWKWINSNHETLAHPQFCLAAGHRLLDGVGAEPIIHTTPSSIQRIQKKPAS